ncbi:hypothetical protein [Noviherbaspirillum soli]|uniref:hypothetical protein n=1 Tax=Noviherbaspirillum soli TaxID=1064518 RepID=UPI00188DC54A|nr:hypothetical protein [Noviherbaspirillum soli]
MKSMASIAAAIVLVSSTNAHAHYLWIEKGSTGHRLHFGEAQMLLKEKSPGRLDTFQEPRALAADSGSTTFNTVPVTRVGDHFALRTKPHARAVVVSEESMPVRDLTKNGLGVAKTNYYARYAPSVIVKSDDFHLPVDVATVGKSDARVLTILYRGQPIKGAKVQVIAPNTWMQEHEAQADGTVQINTPWRGQYVVHVLHVDKTPGEYGGQKYDTVRNHYTLTFVQDNGTRAGPTIPPKQTME